MHASSLENMQRCVRSYAVPGARVAAELGSSDVNGSYRALFGDQIRYVGLDLAAGPGVDIVQTDPHRIPLDDGSIDIVLSGQMLEHCPQFWRVFTEIARIMKQDAVAYIIAPSAGAIHRYPVDCYRFYPDAFVALAEWSGLRLVDIWLDERGPWRDLVGVFQKGGTLTKAVAPPPEAVVPVAPTAAHPDPAAEATAGARHYLDVLRVIHTRLAPALYLEIGVRKGASLALATGPAIAVDPAPEVGELPDRVRLYRTTSDDFFFFDPAAIAKGSVDLAFIDGLHLFENVYRDFMNVERLMSPRGVIVIDDIFPNHPVQAARTRASRVWTGDVWRFADLLARLRPDLRLTFLDTAPTGLLIVTRVKPANMTLWNQYNPLMRQTLATEVAVPESFLRRTDARPPTDAAIAAAIGA